MYAAERRLLVHMDADFEVSDVLDTAGVYNP